MNEQRIRSGAKCFNDELKNKKKERRNARDYGTNGSRGFAIVGRALLVQSTLSGPNGRRVVFLGHVYAVLYLIKLKKMRFISCFDYRGNKLAVVMQELSTEVRFEKNADENLMHGL